MTFSFQVIIAVVRIAILNYFKGNIFGISDQSVCQNHRPMPRLFALYLRQIVLLTEQSKSLAFQGYPSEVAINFITVYVFCLANFCAMAGAKAIPVT